MRSVVKAYDAGKMRSRQHRHKSRWLLKLDCGHFEERRGYRPVVRAICAVCDCEHGDPLWINTMIAHSNKRAAEAARLEAICAPV